MRSPFDPMAYVTTTLTPTATGGTVTMGRWLDASALRRRKASGPGKQGREGVVQTRPGSSEVRDMDEADRQQRVAAAKPSDRLWCGAIDRRGFFRLCAKAGFNDARAFATIKHMVERGKYIPPAAISIFRGEFSPIKIVGLAEPAPCPQELALRANTECGFDRTPPRDLLAEGQSSPT
jgi:hypothetical protein